MTVQELLRSKGTWVEMMSAAVTVSTGTAQIPLEPAHDLGAVLERYRVSLVILSGPAIGLEIPAEQQQLTVGRGPGVDVALDNPSLARAHFAIEFSGLGFRLRALTEDRGIRLNGSEVTLCELHDGDRIRIGDAALQFVQSERPHLKHTGGRRQSAVRLSCGVAPIPRL